MMMLMLETNVCCFVNHSMASTSANGESNPNKRASANDLLQLSKEDLMANIVGDAALDDVTERCRVVVVRQLTLHLMGCSFGRNPIMPQRLPRVTRHDRSIPSDFRDHAWKTPRALFRFYAMVVWMLLGCRCGVVSAFLLHHHHHHPAPVARRTTNAGRPFSSPFGKISCDELPMVVSNKDASRTRRGQLYAGPASRTNHGDDDQDIATIKPSPTTKMTLQRRLRLVILSDTHGMHDQLPRPLPTGDVLIHLGDFARDDDDDNPGSNNKNQQHPSKHKKRAGKRKRRQELQDESALELEAWLTSLQQEPSSFRHMFVLRGNHDPRGWEPPENDNPNKEDTASMTYIAMEPRTVTLHMPMDDDESTHKSGKELDDDDDNHNATPKIAVHFHFVPHMSSGARRVRMQTKTLLPNMMDHEVDNNDSDKDTTTVQKLTNTNDGSANNNQHHHVHILCTHAPPYGLLDETYSKARAGSTALRNAVEQQAQRVQHVHHQDRQRQYQPHGPRKAMSKNKRQRHSNDAHRQQAPQTHHKQPTAPVLWLCGHIHEGRGVVRHNFGGEEEEIAAEHEHEKEPNDGEDRPTFVQSTVIVNAANANPGRARRLDYGPMVVDLVTTTTKTTTVATSKNNNTTSSSKTTTRVEIQSVGEPLHAEVAQDCTNVGSRMVTTASANHFDNPTNADDDTQEQQPVLDFFRNAYFGD